jgi:hypothetical protein
MAGKRTPVSKQNEIKRLIGLDLSNRAIARALGVSRNKVAALKSGSESSDGSLPPADVPPPEWTKNVDWKALESDFRAGTTLAILWQELSESGQIQVQYPAFWKQFSKRFPDAKVSMHRVFKPGSRIEIDYCDGLDFYDPISGEVHSTQLFVGTLCHSRYAFAEFSLTQKSQDFLSSHVRMFEYFGGVAETLSPDNLKSAVTKSHRYDPELNPAYTRLAEHYQVAVVPARVRTPKDKAIVERTIQIFQKWFFGQVRNRTFTSLVELNTCLREHLIAFNGRKHRIFRQSRTEMFLEERKALRVLPAEPYLVSTHTTARLHPDCHLSFEKNFYSAPEHLRGELLDVWASEKLVEIFYKGERVATHSKIAGQGNFVTKKSHYPEAQRVYAESTPSFLLQTAQKIGPKTHQFIEKLLSSETPLRHLRRAQGIVRLGKEHPHSHLEEACAKALQLNQNSYGFIERVLKNRKGEMNRNTNNYPSEQNIQRGENPFLRGYSLLH